MNGKIITRIVVVISILGLSLLGTTPDSAEAIQQVETNDHELYMPYIINSYYPVNVLHSGFCIDKSLNSDCILGQIVNNTNKTVYNVSIIADVFENGVLTQTYTSTTWLPATFPGGTNPFQFGISLYVNYGTDLTVSIESFDFENEPEYLPLTILSKIYSGSMFSGYLTGQIRNDTLDTIEGIKVVVDGAYPGFTSAMVITSTLAPGETTSYTSDPLYFPPWQNGESFTVWAQGAVAP